MTANLVLTGNHRFVAPAILRKILIRLIILLICGSPTMASPSFAQSPRLFQKPFPSIATLRQACEVGLAADAAGPAKTGETPLRISGITTISAAEAKCVIDRYPNAVLIIDATGEVQIKDAFPMRWAAVPGSNDQAQREVARVMGSLSNVRESLPIIVYCHNARCVLSPLAARRIREAGYGPVLWMREGIEAWRMAGYPTSNEVSRWLKPSREKIPKLRACFNAQPLPATGADFEALVEQMLSKCKAEEADFRATLAPWFLPSQVDGETASVRKLISRSGPKYDQFINELARRKDTKRAEESAEYAADLQRRRGIGVSAKDRIPGFEMCWVAVDSPQYTRFFIYSDVYPSVMGREGAEDLRTFNLLNSDSERGKAFINAVRLPPQLVALKVKYLGQNGCRSFLSRAEGEANRSKQLQESGGRNLAFSWHP